MTVFRERGFALGVVLSLLPVLTLMAWTFLEFGTVSRAKALAGEADIRGLQAAESGIRLFMATGEARNFEINDCEVQVSLQNTTLISRATTKRSGHIFEIALETEKGFVTRRRTNEKN